MVDRTLKNDPSNRYGMSHLLLLKALRPIFLDLTAVLPKKKTATSSLFLWQGAVFNDRTPICYSIHDG